VAIETRSPDQAIFKSLFQVCLVDDTAASSVDKDGILLHHLELGTRDQIPGLWNKRDMEGNDIRQLEEILDFVDALVVNVGPGIFGQEWVVGHDATTQTLLEYPGDSLPDITHANDTNGLLADDETGTCLLGDFLVLRLKRCNSAHLASHRHGECEHCFCNGLRIDARGIENLDTPFPACLCVNLVDAFLC
jgi:hypothetical protein